MASSLLAELIERYELAVFAWRDMADARYLTGVDSGAAVRWELYHAGEALGAVGVSEWEPNQIQSPALVKLAALQRLMGEFAEEAIVVDLVPGVPSREVFQSL